MYFELGGKIFGKNISGGIFLRSKNFIKAGYDHVPLETELKNVFGDITLESDKIKTGLCIVAKRSDTNSVWPLINHPKGKYFNSVDGKNKDILVVESR